jgi:hypothetical protein
MNSKGFMLCKEYFCKFMDFICSLRKLLSHHQDKNILFGIIQVFIISFKVIKNHSSQTSKNSFFSSKYLSFSSIFFIISIFGFQEFFLIFLIKSFIQISILSNHTITHFF